MPICLLSFSLAPMNNLSFFSQTRHLIVIQIAAFFYACINGISSHCFQHLSYVDNVYNIVYTVHKKSQCSYPTECKNLLTEACQSLFLIWLFDFNFQRLTVMLEFYIEPMKRKQYKIFVTSILFRERFLGKNMAQPVLE